MSIGGGTAAYSKSDCLLFVTIFPHLIAGPILYHKDMIPQFSQSERYRVNFRNLSLGLVWFVIGLLKTFLTGGVSMFIFFFIFLLIFPNLENSAKSLEKRYEKAKDSDMSDEKKEDC